MDYTIASASTAFGRNWRLASEGFEEAVKRIDEAIKKLTRGNPTMAAKFAELRVSTPD